MEQKELRQNVLAILAGVCNSPHFWELQKNLKGASFLLEYLLENNGESTPGRLAALLHVSGARITAILTAMQSKQFVERHADAADKRRVTVRLTDSGRAFAEDVRAQVSAFSDNICAVLGDADTAHLIRIANKLLDAELMTQSAKGGAAQ